MFRVKCDTQSEFESVVKKMEKETGLKCNVKNMPSEFRYVTTTVIDRTGDSMISLGSAETEDTISAKKYLKWRE